MVVGSAEDGSGSTAFVWDQVNGTRSIKSVLVNGFGFDLTGWTLTSANGISADGTTMTGYGTNLSGLGEGWVAVIPRVLDCNSNGIPDDLDIAGGFSQDCTGNGVPDECDILSCPGDVNGDWTVDLTDLGDLLVQFGSTSGCLSADRNLDGVVDLTDLGILLLAFGDVCR